MGTPERWRTAPESGLGPPGTLATDIRSGCGQTVIARVARPSRAGDVLERGSDGEDEGAARQLVMVVVSAAR